MKTVRVVLLGALMLLALWSTPRAAQACPS